MARFTRFRALRPEFIRFIESHSGWPTEKLILPWMRQNIGGMKKDRYTAIKRGEVVAEKYLQGLVMLRDDTSGNKDVRKFAHLTVEYLKSSGITDSHPLSTDDLVELLCSPVETKPTRSNGDWILKGVRALGDLFDVRRRIESNLMPCENDADVEEAAKWTLAAVGHAHREDQTISSEEAIIAGERRMQMFLPQYRDKLICWWKACPWTVLLTRGDRKPGGVSVVLPLTARAYDDIRRGKRCSSQLTEKDITVPSRNILLEVIEERPQSLGGEARDLTRGLLTVALSQIAWFSRDSEDRSSGLLRVLCFNGTKHSVKRANAYGFRAVGTRYERLQLDIFERLLPLDGGSLPSDLVLAGLFHVMSHTIEQNEENLTGKE